jgi:hypothetical protein
MVTMRSRPLKLLPRAASLITVALLFVLAAAPLQASDDPPPARDATDYPAVDVHAKENVAIAAEPFDTPKKCKVFQVYYLKYRFLPIRIIVTNQGNTPISLKDARIYFISAAGDRIQAAEPEDVERRVRPKDSRGVNIPVGPIKIHTKGKDSDPKIEKDFNQFEYAALAVEPHTTRAGFLFYDMDGLGNDPLHGAKLVLRELRNASGNELFFFEIPFDKYLDAQKRH